MASAEVSAQMGRPVARRRVAVMGVGFVLLAGLAAGGWAWLSSTRPADPLVFSSGLGFEGAGRTGVRVGRPIAFVTWLMSSVPVTVTGYEAVQPQDMTIRVAAIEGAPPARAGLPVIADPRPGQAVFNAGVVVRSRLVPVVGRRSRTVPASLRGAGVRYLLPIAILATVHRPGCHRLGRVTINYRVGDSTFHRSSYPAAGFVSTSQRSCFGVATSNVGVFRAP